MTSVRKVQAEPEVEKGHGLLMPDKDAKPLGMEVPDIPKVEEEEDDIDIFDGVGDEYDPLAGLSEEDSDEAEKEDGEVEERGGPSETGAGVCLWASRRNGLMKIIVHRHHHHPLRGVM